MCPGPEPWQERDGSKRSQVTSPTDTEATVCLNQEQSTKAIIRGRQTGMRGTSRQGNNYRCNIQAWALGHREKASKTGRCGKSVRVPGRRQVQREYGPRGTRLSLPLGKGLPLFHGVTNGPEMLKEIMLPSYPFVYKWKKRKVCRSSTWPRHVCSSKFGPHSTAADPAGWRHIWMYRSPRIGIGRIREN